MSVDLVGSTALKQSGEFPIKEVSGDEPLRDLGPSWLLDIASFYRQIESNFRQEWHRYSSEIAPSCGWHVFDSPSLWKVNGDELIYVATLNNGREAVVALCCWLTACVRYREDLVAKGSKLDVKMAAWTAGFPLSNTEVIFHKQSIDSDDWQPEVLHYHLLEEWHNAGQSSEILSYDFIGPSIDTGFRLAERATPRKFMVGLELAFLLSIVPVPNELPALYLMYDGQAILKGVMGGRPYPLFWIDAHQSNGLSAKEDLLLGLKRLDRAHIRDFCDEYIATNEKHMLRPFIWTDTEPLLNRVPKNYTEKLQRLVVSWENAKRSRDVYLKSMAETPEGSADQIDIELPTGPQN